MASKDKWFLVISGQAFIITFSVWWNSTVLFYGFPGTHPTRFTLFFAVCVWERFTTLAFYAVNWSFVWNRTAARDRRLLSLKAIRALQTLVLVSWCRVGFPVDLFCLARKWFSKWTYLWVKKWNDEKYLKQRVQRLALQRDSLTENVNELRHGRVCCRRHCFPSLAAGMKATSFPGFSPCSVGWIGENPGNEVGMKVACSRRSDKTYTISCRFLFLVPFFSVFRCKRMWSGHWHQGASKSVKNRRIEGRLNVVGGGHWDLRCR